MTLTDRAGPGCDTTDGAGDLGVTLTDRAGPGCDTH